MECLPLLTPPKTITSARNLLWGLQKDLHIIRRHFFLEVVVRHLLIRYEQIYLNIRMAFSIVLSNYLAKIKRFSRIFTGANSPLVCTIEYPYAPQLWQTMPANVILRRSFPLLSSESLLVTLWSYWTNCSALTGSEISSNLSYTHVVGDFFPYFRLFSFSFPTRSYILSVKISPYLLSIKLIHWFCSSSCCPLFLILSFAYLNILYYF